MELRWLALPAGSAIMHRKKQEIFRATLRAFIRWREFANGVLGVPNFPVSPTDCSLYFLYLLESSKSTSAINCAFYAFTWPHQIAGVDSPTLHPTVIAVKEGALRLVSQPASERKELLKMIHLKQLAEKTGFDNLLQLRSLVMFILAFPVSSEVQNFVSFVVGTFSSV